MGGKEWTRAYHNTVDGRVNTKCLTDDCVKQRQPFHFFEGHGAKRAILIGEVLNLFLVQIVTVYMSARSRS